MSSQSVEDVSEVLLATSLPIESGDIERAAERIIDFYATAPASVSLPPEEVADRFSELWHLWFGGSEGPKGELKSLVKAAVSVDQDSGSLACSFGVAAAGPEDTPDTLVARADAALYDAKQHGRDQVVAR